MEALAKNKATIIAAALLAAAIIGGWLGVQAWQNAQGEGTLTVIVHDSNGETYEFNLAEDTTQTIEVEGVGYNTVTIEAGEVYVSDADCSNHDCINQGKISKAGKQIICLPHKLWIEISSDGSTSEMDESATNEDDYDVIGR